MTRITPDVYIRKIGGKTRHNVMSYCLFISSLSLLTWPPFFAIVINIGGWSSLLGSEDSWHTRHCPYWVTCYIISNPSYLRLIVLSYPSHISPLPSSLHTLLSLSISLRFFCPRLPPLPPLMHAPPYYPGYTERYAPTIACICAVPASIMPPDTTP